MQVLKQHMLPSQHWMLDAKPILSIMSIQQLGFVVQESGCWISLPAVQTFHQLKYVFQMSSNWSPVFPDI